MEHLTLQLLGKFQLFLDRSGTFLFMKKKTRIIFFLIMEQLDKLVTEISFELVFVFAKTPIAGSSLDGKVT